jgi:hypothetical protein
VERRASPPGISRHDRQQAPTAGTDGRGRPSLLYSGLYLATMPLGFEGLTTVIGLFMEPVVVLTLKPVMLLDVLFDT